MNDVGRGRARVGPLHIYWNWVATCFCGMCVSVCRAIYWRRRQSIKKRKSSISGFFSLFNFSLFRWRKPESKYLCWLIEPIPLMLQRKGDAKSFGWHGIHFDCAKKCGQIAKIYDLFSQYTISSWIRYILCFFIDFWFSGRTFALHNLRIYVLRNK